MDNSLAFLSTPAGTITMLALFEAVTSAIAYRKGFDWPGWFILGAALFVVALPVVLVKRRNQEELDERAINDGVMQRCPKCAELVKAEAKVCRFCGNALAGPTALATSAT